MTPPTSKRTGPDDARHIHLQLVSCSKVGGPHQASLLSRKEVRDTLSICTVFEQPA